MHKWFILLAALPLTASARPAETPQSLSAVQTTSAYVQSQDGFHAQLEAIVQYYRAGDEKDGRHLIDQFRLPHSGEWFSEHLGPAQSTELTTRYDRLFANFAESLEKTIKAVVANPSADLLTELGEGKGERPSNIRAGAKTSGIVSVKQPHLFYGRFKIQVQKKDSTLWADTFAYEDGAFRFAGFGAWPFWVWEDGSEGGAPKGGMFSQPPILITKIAPIYPLFARANGLEGVVVIHALIDKEGRVKSADIVDGDPLLAQAALDAVRQWRYKPSTLGGAPAESETTEKVVFALRNPKVRSMP
jgi:TonB family protein